MTAAFERRGGLADLAHILVLEVDQVAERPDIPQGAWLGRSVAVDIKRIGHITGLAADLDAPVSRCQLSE